MIHKDHSFIEVQSSSKLQDLSFEFALTHTKHPNQKNPNKPKKGRRHSKRGSKKAKKNRKSGKNTGFVEFLRDTKNDCVNLGRKIITNTKYSLSKTKKYSRKKILSKQGYITLLGGKIMGFEIGLAKAEARLAEFERHVRWCSYREGMKSLNGSKGKVFKTDASRVLLLFKYKIFLYWDLKFFY